MSVISVVRNVVRKHFLKESKYRGKEAAVYYWKFYFTHNLFVQSGQNKKLFYFFHQIILKVSKAKPGLVMRLLLWCLSEAPEAAALLGAAVDSLMCVWQTQLLWERDFIATLVHGCYWVLAAMLQVQRSGLVAARGIEAPFIQCFHSGLTLFFCSACELERFMLSVKAVAVFTEMYTPGK